MFPYLRGFYYYLFLLYPPGLCLDPGPPTNTSSYYSRGAITFGSGCGAPNPSYSAICLIVLIVSK